MIPCWVHTWQVLQRDIVYNLIIATLEKGGINRHKWSQTLTGQAGSKSDRMLLGNAYIVHALREDLHEVRTTGNGYRSRGQHWDKSQSR